MGAIAAKFRKEKTTYQILEKLEQEIKDIEQYSVSTQARQKRYVGNFLVISIGLYVIGFIVFYFVFFPPTWMERITYSVPLLIFPLLIFLLKRLVAWYFQRKLNKNSNKLDTLRAEKKKVIEKVMDKETYKVALAILNRFGGQKSNDLKSPGLTPRTTTSTPTMQQQQSQTGYRPASAFQQKSVTSVPQFISIQQRTTSTSPMNRFISPLTPIRQNSDNLMPSPSSGFVTHRNTNYSLQVQKKRTPYPIINQQDKGVLEKMVDYLIGDGPHNRFAMICKECFGHNGMALQEEYEYAAFRCAYCNTMNPSRKSRPVAPKLPMPTSMHPIDGGDVLKRRRDSTSPSTSTSEKDSGSDSDDDVQKEEDVKEAEQIEEIKSENKSEDDIATVPSDTTANTTEPTDKTDENKKND